METKNILIFTFVLLTILVIVYLYFLNRGHKNLHKSYDLFIKDKEVYANTNELEPSKDGVRYSLSLWIRPNNLYLNTDWDTNPKLPKTIINNNGSPDIYWFPETNLLKIQVIYSEMGDFKYYDFELENFETQRWSNLVITVHNKEIIIYKNGEIYSVKNIDNPNLLNYRMMEIGEKNNNFNGYIGDIDYYNYVLDKKKVKKLYKKYLKRHPNKVKRYQHYLNKSINQ